MVPGMTRRTVAIALPQPQIRVYPAKTAVKKGLTKITCHYRLSADSARLSASTAQAEAGADPLRNLRRASTRGAASADGRASEHHSTFVRVDDCRHCDAQYRKGRCRRLRVYGLTRCHHWDPRCLTGSRLGMLSPHHDAVQGLGRMRLWPRSDP